MSTNIGIFLPRTDPTYSEIIVQGTSLQWSSIASSRDGAKIIASASEGYIYTSDDSGVTWTPRMTDTTRQWYSVASSDDGTILCACVPNSYIYTSDDSGVTWTPRMTDVVRDWTSVSMSANGSIMFACANLRPLYKSTDLGVTWSPQTIGTDSSQPWKSIKVSSDGMYVIACSWLFNNYGFVHTSSDSGENWKRAIDTTDRNYVDVALSDDGKIMVAIVYGSGGGLYLSNNYGLTWVRQISIGDKNWSGVSISPSGNKIVACVYNQLIYETNDFGTKWMTRMSSKKWSTVKIVGNNEDQILATVGRQKNGTGSSADIGNLFKIDVSLPIIESVFKPYTSGNKQEINMYTLPVYNKWIKQTNSGNKNWQSITSSSDGVKLAACVINDYIYTSTNSGATWLQRINAGSQPWKSITSSSDGSILTACVNNGYIWRSTDSGQSWRQQASKRNWKSITSSADGTKIFGCEFGQYIWRSINSGLRWSARVDLYDWTSIVCSSDGSIVAATIGNGYIWISNDSGNTWSEQTSSGIRNWSSITSSSNGNLLAACVNDGYIYTSTDSGQTWSENTSSGSRNWYGITSSSNGLILSACANNDFIYTSTNGGQSWLKQVLSISNSWNSIAASSLGINVAACAQDDFIYTQIVNDSLDIGFNFNLLNNTASALTYNTGILQYVKYPFGSRDLNTPPIPEVDMGVTAIAASSDGTKLVAVAKSYYIMSSSNSGKTWKIIRYDVTAVSQYKYDSVAISGDGNVICVTENGGGGFNSNCHITTNNGNTWSLRSVPNGATRVFLSNNGNTIIVQGRVNAALKSTTFGPNTWTTLTAGDAAADTIVANSDNSVILLTGNNHRVWISTNSGTSFENKNPLASLATKGNFYAAMSSTGEKIAVFEKNSGYFGLSTNTGNTWSSVTNINYIVDIALSPDGTTINALHSDGISTSTNFGVSWTKKTISGLSQMNRLFISSNRENIITNTSAGKIYVSTNSGTSGQFIVIPFPEMLRTRAVALSYDGTKRAAIGFSQYGNVRELHITTNSGNSWTRKTVPMTDCFDMNTSYDFSVLIADDLSGNVITSTDSGVNWKTQTTLGSKNWRGSCVSGDGNVLSVCESSGYIWISNNKGGTWNQRAESASWRYTQSSYDGKIIISGRNNGKIWRSTDSGVNWAEIVNSPTVTSWAGIFLSSDGSTIMASQNTQRAVGDFETTDDIYISYDYGVTWSITSLPIRTDSNNNNDKNVLVASADGKKIIVAKTNNDLLISCNRGLANSWRSRTKETVYIYSNIRNDIAISGDGSTVMIAGGTPYYDNLYMSSDSFNVELDINSFFEKK